MRNAFATYPAMTVGVPLDLELGAESWYFEIQQVARMPRNIHKEKERKEKEEKKRQEKEKKRIEMK